MPLSRKLFLLVGITLLGSTKLGPGLTGRQLGLLQWVGPPALGLLWQLPRHGHPILGSWALVQSGGRAFPDVNLDDSQLKSPCNKVFNYMSSIPKGFVPQQPRTRRSSSVHTRRELEKRD